MRFNRQRWSWYLVVSGLGVVLFAALARVDCVRTDADHRLGPTPGAAIGVGRERGQDSFREPVREKSPDPFSGLTTILEVDRRLQSITFETNEVRQSPIRLWMGVLASLRLFGLPALRCRLDRRRSP